MSLYGVRYRNPIDGPLIKVGPRAEATWLSRHADCMTWVVKVDHDLHNRVVQVGHPLAHHDGRIPGNVPEPAPRPEPELVAPSTHATRQRAARAYRRPGPTRARKLAKEAAAESRDQALIRANTNGQRIRGRQTRKALIAAGFVSEDGYLTPAGEREAQRLVERELAGVSS